MEELEINKTIIECECGMHMLAVESEVEYIKVEGGHRYNQTFYLAMFGYSNLKRESIWKRICVIWNYLKTDNMHRDQLMLTPQEAKKLSRFISDNNVEKNNTTCPDCGEKMFAFDLTHYNCKKCGSKYEN